MSSSIETSELTENASYISARLLFFAKIFLFETIFETVSSQLLTLAIFEKCSKLSSVASSAESISRTFKYKSRWPLSVNSPNCGDIPASKGNFLNKDEQNACIV